jgi:hypothetical protein
MEYRYGKIKKMVVNPLEFAKESIYDMVKEPPSYYDMTDDEDVMEYFLDEFYEKYLFINNELYEIIEQNSYDNESSRFESKQLEDGTITFNVAYYNGGCSFQEAIDFALGNMSN